MAQSLNLVFCGTPAFAVPALENLVQADFPVRLVVTQPDRPRGRGLELFRSPVKECALALGLPITQPDRIKNNQEFRAHLQALQPDAIVVVGYGRIIPQWMIDLPRLGNINLHGSLLPKYRGAAPVQWAIACGETVTGVTTMRIDAGLDTGDILQQKELPIAPNDTAEIVAGRLAAMGAELMVATLRGLQDGTVRPIPQDNLQATLAPILRKENGKIDFHRPAPEIVNRLRGFQPWPGAYTGFRGKHLQVWAAEACAGEGAEGELRLAGEHLLVGCGQGTMLEITELQPEGKKRMAAGDFIHGYHPRAGDKLD